MAVDEDVDDVETVVVADKVWELVTVLVIVGVEVDVTDDVTVEVVDVVTVPEAEGDALVVWVSDADQEVDEVDVLVADGVTVEDAVEVCDNV